MLAWYVVRLQAGLNATVMAGLKRLAFVESYQAIGKDWRTGKRIGFALRPVQLFPGYLFVRFDIDADPWWEINKVRGTVGLLSGTRGTAEEVAWPGKLPAGFVEDLQRLAALGLLDAVEAEKAVYRYSPGEVVRINSGSWSGHHGEFVRYHRGSLILLVGLLGRKIELPVRPDQTSPGAETLGSPGAGASVKANKQQEKVAA